ncbi:ABC transporter substrate-binding protein [Amycolatopsis roodepoortensis]|uniref:ABC transporter substrate-binding protein n=1 Tax=Amycolatopsis roodepoortensis TaxID=700274 RepID=UPI00214B94E6|nr:ABC transporter substrate-binding protein [Amycolatopsis roodepoortensis]UUV32241.1 ABC transporter substrate-binding protein [Amycolatopsis roodepoortensis]
MRSLQPHRRRYAAALRSLLGAALLLSTSACGLLGGESDQPSGARPSVKATVMTILDSAPLRWAVEQGYFTDAGITVTQIPAESGQYGIDKLSSGDADIAYAGDVAIISAIANGRLELRVIAQAAMAGPENMWIMVRDDGSVPNVTDLAGKRIAHNGTNGVSHMLTRTVMATHKVDTSTVRWTTAKFPDMPGLLERGEIDAALLPEPYVTPATKRHLKQLIDPVKGGGFEQSIPTGSYVVTAAWAQQHPAEIAAFQRALRRAAAEVTSKPEIVQQLAVREMKVDAGDAQLMKLPIFPLSPSAVQLQRWADLMHSFGVVKQPVRMSDLVIAPPPDQ